MISFILFIFILGLLVIIHEFGHFIAAKKNGILVEEFGIGFPPRLWGKKIGETLYSINAVPLGGFVKLFGEEQNEIDGKPLPKTLSDKAFVNKTALQKSVVILAGVAMNAILGITIYYLLLSLNGFKSDPIPMITNYHFRFGVQEGRVVAGNIVKDSPAEKAGIKVEDSVIRYQTPENASTNTWKPVTSSGELINLIKSSPNRILQLDIENVKNGSRKIVSVMPVYNADLKRAIIGVNLIDTAIISYQKTHQMIFAGFMHSYNILTYNFSTIGELIRMSVKEKTFAPVSQTVSGPIGIFSVVQDVVATSGTKLFKNLLNIVGLLSLSLAFMNVLPLPALDGGRLLFILIEYVTRRRINKTVEQYVNMAGFFALIALGIAVSVNDVLRLFK